MMRNQYILHMVCLFAVLASCQPAERLDYQSPVFENIRRETYTYAVKQTDTLGMDVFIPDDNPANQRPVILYVHGGGFSGGRRDDSLHLDFCNRLALHGYIAATMSYRLVMKGQSFHCDQPAENKIRTFQSVTEDILDATAFLLDRQSEMKLNPNQIVLAGSSAGAEAVLHTVYGDQSPETLNQYLNKPQYQYAGVISMAGAIVDTANIHPQSAIPTQLFHGTCDKLVPYASAPHHYCDSSTVGFLPLHGAYSITERLEELGASYYLHTTCNGGHELASQPKRLYFEEIVDFLYQDVMIDQNRQIRKEVVKKDATCDLEANMSYCN